jgi:very-short-patch-repair endonuclease
VAGRARFKTSARRLAQAPRLSVRAKKLGPLYRRPNALPDVTPLLGMNGPETRIALALREMGIRFTTQQSFMGGSILGGSRADFVLPTYRIVMNFDGPFHTTGYGLARQTLVDATYRAQGYITRPLKQADLYDLKRSILRLIGVPL